MRHYQIFPFSADGRLLDAVALDFESDARAIRRVIDPDFPNGCELWEGFRFVGRFHGAVAPAEAPPPVAPPRVLVH
jgi:hypothetical protein